MILFRIGCANPTEARGAALGAPRGILGEKKHGRVCGGDA